MPFGFGGSIMLKSYSKKFTFFIVSVICITLLNNCKDEPEITCEELKLDRNWEAIAGKEECLRSDRALAYLALGGFDSFDYLEDRVYDLTRTLALSAENWRRKQNFFSKAAKLVKPGYMTGSGAEKTIFMVASYLSLYVIVIGELDNGEGMDTTAFDGKIESSEIEAFIGEGLNPLTNFKMELSFSGLIQANIEGQYYIFDLSVLEASGHNDASIRKVMNTDAAENDPTVIDQLFGSIYDSSEWEKLLQTFKDNGTLILNGPATDATADLPVLVDQLSGSIYDFEKWKDFIQLSEYSESPVMKDLDADAVEDIPVLIDPLSGLIHDVSNWKEINLIMNVNGRQDHPGYFNPAGVDETIAFFNQVNGFLRDLKTVLEIINSERTEETVEEITEYSERIDNGGECALLNKNPVLRELEMLGSGSRTRKYPRSDGNSYRDDNLFKLYELNEAKEISFLDATQDIENNESQISQKIGVKLRFLSSSGEYIPYWSEACDDIKATMEIISRFKPSAAERNDGKVSLSEVICSSELLSKSD